MKRFSELVWALDASNRTNDKVAALAAYFREAPPEDAVWALHVLTGRRVKRAIQGGRLREWVAEAADLPLWLLERSYEQVGDLAETLARILPERPAAERPEPLPLHRLFAERVLPLPELDDEEKRPLLLTSLMELAIPERFVFLKLITGAFRLGVGTRLVTRALARAAGVEPAAMAHRIAGQWEPTAETYRAFFADDSTDDPARPYPFFLAHPLEREPHTLGPAAEWQAEWKWDGIRLQVIRRGGTSLLWSRGEELVSGQFPELLEVAGALPDGTVLDGEAMAWSGEIPLGFDQLQRRLGRKKVGPKLLREVPVALNAYDVMEVGGGDVRDRPLRERRRLLEEVVGRVRADRLDLHAHLRISETIAADDWEALATARGEARERGVEGLMLKRLDSVYGVGRVRGTWWKWKVEPLTLDTVLVYAQAGRGRRAGLHTDYTLAVRDGDDWVPIAKAYSGLSDAELRRMDRWIRRNTIEKFGPVRSVPVEHVFEIAFEGIRRSTRHKSGIALRFPRIARWRTDKPVEEADTLDTAKALLEVHG